MVSFLPRAGRSPRLTTCSLLALLLAPVACSRPPAEVDLGAGTTVQSAPSRARLGMSSYERFGRQDPNAIAKQQQTEEEGFHYVLPDGWTVNEPTDMRFINLHPAGVKNAECYVTLLGGDGGGMVANLNRWRTQMGLEEATKEALLALPTIKLFGRDASFLELEGSFAGMDGVAVSGFGLLGTLISTPQATIFVKMTAPLEIIQAEREAFIMFCDSIAPPGMGDSAQEDHASHSAPTGPQKEDDGSFVAAGFRFFLPEGWSDAGPRSMRALNFKVGEQTQCWLSVLGGDGGGLLPNLNRWRGQMGMETITEADIDALPRVNFLGEPAILLTAQGEFTSREGEASSGRTLIGLALMRPNDALFLKMLGPTDEVETHRDAMLAFAETIEEVQ